MKKAALLILLLLVSGCAIKRVETSKTIYQHARQAQEAANDLQATLYWKALLEQTTKEIEAGHYPVTNYFLRASAHFELGEWDHGFEDLKQVQPQGLSSGEFWIYPLYSILMGDYYAQQQMTAVAGNFYQSVLRKSTYKASPVYLLALERHMNNLIKAVEFQAKDRVDGEKFKQKEYEGLVKDLMKYVEEFPHSSVPHFLLGDLMLKMGRANDAMEHLLAALEMTLPTVDLRRSAEFEIATLLSSHQVSPELKTVLLRKARQWWGKENNGSIFRFGENTLEWVRRQDSRSEIPPEMRPDQKVSYLAVSRGNEWKILVWEKQ